MLRLRHNVKQHSDAVKSSILIPMKENTAKNFVIQLGSLIALYVSVSALLVLIFGVINIKFPDEAVGYWQSDSARESIRASIAILFVFFPTYLTLTRISNQIRRKEEEGRYTGLAKWLVYLSLLAGGAIILGDLVTILKFFLDGEITIRFILKAVALLVVVGISFGYYLLDVKGHFASKEQQSFMFGGVATLLVIAGLIFGFMNIETPSEVREMKLDQQQVTDLQEIQWAIEHYYAINQTLPTTIAEVFDDTKPPQENDVRIPQAPTGREAYQYFVTSDTTYQLCATFVAPNSNAGRPYTYPAGEQNYNWTHGAGEKCFDRVVVPNAVTKPVVLDF